MVVDPMFCLSPTVTSSQKIDGTSMESRAPKACMSRWQSLADVTVENFSSSSALFSGRKETWNMCNLSRLYLQHIRVISMELQPEEKPNMGSNRSYRTMALGGLWFCWKPRSNPSQAWRFVYRINILIQPPITFSNFLDQLSNGNRGMRT